MSTFSLESLHGGKIFLFWILTRNFRISTSKSVTGHKIGLGINLRYQIRGGTGRYRWKMAIFGCFLPIFANATTSVNISAEDFVPGHKIECQTETASNKSFDRTFPRQMTIFGCFRPFWEFFLAYADILASIFIPEYKIERRIDLRHQISFNQQFRKSTIFLPFWIGQKKSLGWLVPTAKAPVKALGTYHDIEKKCSALTQIVAVYYHLQQFQFHFRAKAWPRVFFFFYRYLMLVHLILLWHMLCFLLSTWLSIYSDLQFLA